MQNVTHIKADDLLVRDGHTFEPQHNSWTFSSALQCPFLRLSTSLHHDTSCAGTVRWQHPWITCLLNHPERTQLIGMLSWLKGSIWSNLGYILLLEALDRRFDPYFAKVSLPASVCPLTHEKGSQYSALGLHSCQLQASRKLLRWILDDVFMQ